MTIYKGRECVRLADLKGAGEFNNDYLHSGEARSLLAASPRKLDVVGVPIRH